MGQLQMTLGDLGQIGHNAREATVRIEVRLFNSLTKFAGVAGPRCTLALRAGATVGDLIDELRLPAPEIFLVLRNGRDVSPGLYGGGLFNREASLEDGDVVAFSGPVPYSYGYGAPVV